MNLFEFSLACYGLTQILIFGSIFNRIRPDGKLFKCPMCMGFWVGVLLSIWFKITGILFVDQLLSGFISSGVSYFLVSIVNDFGLKVNQTNLTKEE